MKKITLFIAIFIFAIGTFAQQIQSNNFTQIHINKSNDVYTSNQAADECSQEVGNYLAFALGGLNKWVFADDLVISSNMTFSLQSIEAYISAPFGGSFDANDVIYGFYADDNGMPGVPIDGGLANTSVEIEIPGATQTDDVWVVTLTFDTPLVFEGGNYWFGLTVTTNEAGKMVATNTVYNGSQFYVYAEVEGSEQWFPGTDAFGFPPSNPGPFDLGLDFFGDCELSVAGVDSISFSQYVQDGQLFLSSPSEINEVVIYNLLGQQVVSKNINATSGNLELGAMNAGVYIAKTIVNGEVKSFKFVLN